MKLTVEKSEVGKVICEVLATKFGGEWECITPDYKIYDHVRVTPEYLAEKAAEAEELRKWREEEKAKRDAPPAAEQVPAPEHF